MAGARARARANIKSRALAGRPLRQRTAWHLASPPRPAAGPGVGLARGGRGSPGLAHGNGVVGPPVGSTAAVVGSRWLPVPPQGHHLPALARLILSLPVVRIAVAYATD